MAGQPQHTMLYHGKCNPDKKQGPCREWGHEEPRTTIPIRQYGCQAGHRVILTQNETFLKCQKSFILIGKVETKHFDTSNSNFFRAFGFTKKNWYFNFLSCYGTKTKHQIIEVSSRIDDRIKNWRSLLGIRVLKGKEEKDVGENRNISKGHNRILEQWGNWRQVI